MFLVIIFTSVTLRAEASYEKKNFQCIVKQFQENHCRAASLDKARYPHLFYFSAVGANRGGWMTGIKYPKINPQEYVQCFAPMPGMPFTGHVKVCHCNDGFVFNVEEQKCTKKSYSPVRPLSNPVRIAKPVITSPDVRPGRVVRPSKPVRPVTNSVIYGHPDPPVTWKPKPPPVTEKYIKPVAWKSEPPVVWKPGSSLSPVSHSGNVHETVNHIRFGGPSRLVQL